MTQPTTMDTLMFAFAAALCDKLAGHLAPGAALRALVIVQTPAGDIHVSGSLSIPAAAVLARGAVAVLERQILLDAAPQGPVQ